MDSLDKSENSAVEKWLKVIIHELHHSIHMDLFRMFI